MLPFLDGAFDGQTFFMFAYGETDSGKTYNTTQSTELTLNRAFAYQKDLHDRRSGTVQISAQCIELYKSKAYAIMPSPNKSQGTRQEITYRENTNSKEWYACEGGENDHNRAPLEHITLSSAKMGAAWLITTAGNLRNKRNMRILKGNTVGQNDKSSRGHLIVKILVTTTSPSGDSTEGSIYLVDLAGNEAMPNPNKDPDAYLESKFVATTLSTLMTTLGEVRMSARKALRTDKPCVPPKLPRECLLVKAIWPALCPTDPRGLIFGTIFQAGHTKANESTLNTLESVSLSFFVLPVNAS